MPRQKGRISVFVYDFLVMERKAHKFIESIKDKRDGIVLYWQDFFGVDVFRMILEVEE